MELGIRIFFAVLLFLLFGFIGVQCGTDTWAEPLIIGLLGVCATFIVFDVPEKIKKSNDSSNNKEDK